MHDPAATDPDEAAEQAAPRVAPWPQRSPSQTRFAPEAVVFDFDVEPQPPRWLARGIVPAEGVTLLTGDAGIGKTWIALDLARAVLTGGEWLGRAVSQGSVVVVDEENSVATVHRRLRALGLDNQSREGLAYFAGNGAQIGDGGRCDTWLTEVLDATPDVRLVVVDTAMSATSLDDVNDNTKVARLLSWLGHTVKAHDCAAVMLHHERKAQQGSTNSRSARVMGANQWRAQVEAHIATGQIGERVSEGDPDGTLRSAFHLDVSVEKLRDGVPPPAQCVRVETLNHDDCIDRATVAVVEPGDIPSTSKPKTKGEVMDETLTSALEDGPLTSEELAETVGRPAQDSTFKRARARLVKAGKIFKCEDARWAATDSVKEVEL